MSSVKLPRTLIAPASVAAAVHADSIRRGYSTRDWATLESGAIVSGASRAADGQHAHAAGILPHAPRALWPLLVDFETRPAYLPGAQSIRILKVAGNRVWLAERLRLLFLTIAYGVINTLEPETGTVSWTLDDRAENDIAATSGAWQLVPVRGGRETLVRYRNVLDTGQPIPGSVERFLLTRTLPQMISGLRDEAARRLA